MKIANLSKISQLCLCLLLGALLLSVQSTIAPAQSFKIKSPKTAEMKIGQRADFQIQNLTKTTKGLSVYILNYDKHLIYSATNASHGLQAINGLVGLVVLGPDSLGGNSGVVSCYYSEGSPKPFASYLLIVDTIVHQVDTITISTHDTITTNNRNILTVDPVLITIQAPDGPLTRAVSIRVKNSDPSVAKVAVALKPQSSNFDISTNTLNIQPTSSQYNGEILTLTYTGKLITGMTDSANLVFTPVIPSYGLPINVRVLVVDTTTPPPTLKISVPSFNQIPPEKTTCKSVVIYNENTVPITLTGLQMSGPDAANFALQPSQSLPVQLAPHSSFTANLCCTMPQSRTSLTAYVNTQYSLDGGVTTLWMAQEQIFATPNRECIVADVQYDTVIIGTVIGEGWVESGVSLRNTLDVPLTLNNLKLSYGGTTTDYITSLDNYPISIAAGESATLHFHFEPKTTAQKYFTAIYDADISGSKDSLCSHLTLQLMGIGQQNSNNVSLFPSQKEALNIKSNSNSTTQRFVFTNNGNQAVKVVGVSLKDGSNFQIQSPLSTDLPKTLQTGESMNVDIAFTSSNTGTFSDQLIITTDHALTSQTFDLHGIRTGATDGVDPINSAAELEIVPNPVHENVTVTAKNVQSAKYELYDALGAVIAHTDNIPAWNINLGSLNLTAGNYYVRVTGMNAAHAPVIITKQIVVIK